MNNSALPAGDYLGFDYGSIRIGLAVGNTIIGTTQPLLTLSNNSGTPDWTPIDKAVSDWAPSGLVVGIPLTLDGNDQPITPHARGFLKALKKRYQITTHAADERFSSMQAQQELQKMRARGQHGKTQKQDVDKLAAALILEHWFAEHTFEVAKSG